METFEPVKDFNTFEPSKPVPPYKQPSQTWENSDDKLWAMLLHFSQFAGYLAPLAGLIVPIVIWQMKKEQSPVIDAHGKNVANWIITEFIAFLVCIPLVFVFVGVPLLMILGVIGIIFPIIGGIKANNGEIWRYPMTFEFIK